MLSRKGRPTLAHRVCEAGLAFVAAHRPNAAMGAAIPNLEHCSLDRVRAYGADGFVRIVALPARAFDIHRLGVLIRCWALKRM